VDRISLSAVAQQSGVSWPTVRRHIGSKERLMEMLLREQGTDVNPDTRSRILAAAARVFARTGIAGGALETVAADAGLSKGAVYWHFTSKNDLVLALLAERIRAHISAVPDPTALFPPDQSPIEGITDHLQSVLDACLTGSDWPRLFFEFAANAREPEVQARLESLYTVIHDAVVRRVSQLVHTNHLAEGIDPETAAVLYVAVADGLMLRSLITPQRLRDAAMPRQMARILVEGLGRQPDKG
jgi:AcrR family transcriptional regulator